MRGSIAEARWAVNFAPLLLCLCARPAAAHPEYAPSTVNRYVRFDLVAADALRVTYTVLVGPGPAASARQAADGNRDGRLEPAETRALGETVRRAATAGAYLTVDGKPLPLRFTPPEVGLAGEAVGPLPFSVDLTAEVPLPGAAPHTIGFEDRTDAPRLGELELRIEESPATRLLFSHRGASGQGRTTHFLFRGPKRSAFEDRSIRFRFAAGPHPLLVPSPHRTARPWWALLTLLAGAGGLWGWRTVRARRAPGDRDKRPDERIRASGEAKRGANVSGGRRDN